MSPDTSTPRPNLLPLETYARISAKLAEGDRTRAEVLREEGQTEDAFAAAEADWNERIVVDTFANGTLAGKLSEAFVRAQDGIRPAPEMSVEAFADLVEAAGAEGLTRTLSAAGLRAADWQRLHRAMARTLGKDRALGRAYAEALYRAIARRKEAK
jgi:hypothetical protein